MFAVWSISIFVLVFVFGILEKSNICIFHNDIWICFGICNFAAFTDIADIHDILSDTDSNDDDTDI